MIKLRKYQKEGVRLIFYFKGRCLLADEMRLGKTIQVLYWLNLIRPKLVIVVCPSIAKWEWASQAKEHINKKTEVLKGQRLYRTNSNFLIINYDILNHWKEYLVGLRPDVVVFDECHYLKGRKTLRFKAAKRLATQRKYLIGISGTPATNRPVELFNIVSLIKPKMFKSFWKYAFRYCRPKHTPWGWDFSGASHIDELSEKLRKNLMIRRTRKEVWKELPEKDRRTIPLDIKNYKEYEEARDNFIEWLRKKNPKKVKSAMRAEALVRIGKLAHLAAELKLDECIKWIEDFLDKTDDKLVVFGIHKNILRPLYEKFKKISVLVDGSVKGWKRKDVQDKFQTNKKTRIFFGNIIAAGTAISLSKAGAVAFIELDRVPGNHTQAEDRMIAYHKKEGGLFFYLIAKGTIEEDICKLTQKKAKILSELFDGNIKSENYNVYDLLLKSLLKGNTI